MTLRQRSARLGLVTSALSIALVAGCGSTVEPSAVETVGPIDGIASTAPVPGSSSVTTPGGASAVPAAGLGGGPALPTTGNPTSNTPGGPTSAEPTTSTGSDGSGASRHTGPITVGFLTTDTSNAGQYGASLGNTVSESGVDRALIDAMNQQGGIDGRKVKVVFAGTDTGSTNWANDFQAACATFTQDHHVDVVLGYEFTYEPAFESCLNKAGIPHLSNGFNVPSNSVLAQYPLFWSLTVPTIGVRNIAKFEGAIKTGFLTPKNKLGLLIDDCPGTQEAWQTEVMPYLKAHHIDYVPPFVAGCSTGNNASASSAVSGVSNGLLKFRSEGVDRIAFVSVSEAPVLYVATVASQAQGYYPGWIVSSLGQLAIIGGEAPVSEMRNTHGYGWMPSQDVPPQYNPALNASQKRCLSLLRSRNVRPRAAADFGYAYNACEAVFLYEKALKLDGGNANGTAISNAVAGVGSGFQSTLNLYGQSVFSSARRNNAPEVFKPINWDGNCHCFRYGSDTFRMP